MTNPYPQTPFPTPASSGSSPFTVSAPASTASAQDTSGYSDPYGLGNLGGVTIFLGDIPVSTGPAYMGGPGRPAAPTTTKLSDSAVSATNYVTQFANSSVSNPQSFAALQAALYTAGFYGTSKPRFGVYTTDDAAAMKKAIQSYVGVVNPSDPNPLTFSDYLDHASAQSTANGPSTPAPPPLSLTDPKELEQTLQAAGQNALGRNLSPDELKAFVSSFHGKEKASYNDQIAGKTYTNPDVSGEAVASIAGAHPIEEQQKLQAGYLDKMNQMLGVL